MNGYCEFFWILEVLDAAIIFMYHLYMVIKTTILAHLHDTACTAPICGVPLSPLRNGFGDRRLPSLVSTCAP